MRCHCIFPSPWVIHKLLSSQQIIGADQKSGQTPSVSARFPYPFIALIRVLCRGGRLCPPLRSYEFAEDFRKNSLFCRADRGVRPYRGCRFPAKRRAHFRGQFSVLPGYQLSNARTRSLTPRDSQIFRAASCSSGLVTWSAFPSRRRWSSAGA